MRILLEFIDCSQDNIFVFFNQGMGFHHPNQSDFDLFIGALLYYCNEKGIVISKNSVAGIPKAIEALQTRGWDHHRGFILPNAVSARPATMPIRPDIDYKITFDYTNPTTFLSPDVTIQGHDPIPLSALLNLPHDMTIKIESNLLSQDPMSLVTAGIVNPAAISFLCGFYTVMLPCVAKNISNTVIALISSLLCIHLLKQNTNPLVTLRATLQSLHQSNAYILATSISSDCIWQPHRYSRAENFDRWTALSLPQWYCLGSRIAADIQQTSNLTLLSGLIIGDLIDQNDVSRTDLIDFYPTGSLDFSSSVSHHQVIQAKGLNRQINSTICAHAPDQLQKLAEV